MTELWDFLEKKKLTASERKKIKKDVQSYMRKWQPGLIVSWRRKIYASGMLGVMIVVLWVYTAYKPAIELEHIQQGLQWVEIQLEDIVDNESEWSDDNTIFYEEELPTRQETQGRTESSSYNSSERVEVSTQEQGETQEDVTSMQNINTEMNDIIDVEENISVRMMDQEDTDMFADEMSDSKPMSESMFFQDADTAQDMSDDASIQIFQDIPEPVEKIQSIEKLYGQELAAYSICIQSDDISVLQSCLAWWQWLWKLQADFPLRYNSLLSLLKNRANNWQ